jgi:rRNA methylases
MRADTRFKLPMNEGQIDSYNVSVATGMILYEAIRQRKRQ